MEVDSGLGCEFVSWLKICIPSVFSIGINIKAEEKEKENKKNIFLDWKKHSNERQCKNLELLLRGRKNICNNVKNYRLDTIWCYGITGSL